MESKLKKKLATAAAGVAVVGAAVSLTAGTFSYFTDSNSTAVQSVHAGHLTIGTALDHRINVSKVAPGWGDTDTFTVKNTGNVSAKLLLKVNDAGSDAAMLDAVKLCGVGTQACVSLGKVENAGEIDTGIVLQPQGLTSITFDVRLPDTGASQDQLQDLQANAILQATLQSVSS